VTPFAIVARALSRPARDRKGKDCRRPLRHEPMLVRRLPACANHLRTTENASLSTKKIGANAGPRWQKAPLFVVIYNNSRGSIQERLAGTLSSCSGWDRQSPGPSFAVIHHIYEFNNLLTNSHALSRALQ